MIALRAPAEAIHTSVNISGSKSISNRLLLLNKILKAGLQLSNLSDAEDTRLLQQALEQMGSSRNGIIDVNHAGTDMRFLTALLSVTPGSWTLTGSARMKQRPIGGLVTALQSLGAEITYLEKENFPPLQINGRQLKGGRAKINAGISSQFVSALLLIAPLFENGLELALTQKIVSRPYIDMTVALLKAFGIPVSTSDTTITVHPFSISLSPSVYSEGSKESQFSVILPHTSSSLYKIESDWSSASYWYEICALSKNAVIELSNFNEQSLQADAVVAELYKQLGVATVFKPDGSIELHNTQQKTSAFHYDFTASPDLAQTLAVTCAGLGIAATLTGLETLKIKETDRIAALKTELQKAGAMVQATNHSIHLEARPASRPLLPFTVSTYHDHRMAMSFAPLAVLCGSIQINDEEVVQKSYPRFWQDLEAAAFNVNLQPD